MKCFIRQFYHFWIERRSSFDKAVDVFKISIDKFIFFSWIERIFGSTVELHSNLIEAKIEEKTGKLFWKWWKNRDSCIWLDFFLTCECGHFLFARHGKCDLLPELPIVDSSAVPLKSCDWLQLGWVQPHLLLATTSSPDHWLVIKRYQKKLSKSSQFYIDMR